MKILEFSNVSKQFMDGDIKVNVLKNINLSLFKGEFVALVGPSGCGKSTLLNLITNLYSPSQGTLLFKGRDINLIKDNEWVDMLQNEIGFIYQYYELIDCLSVYDNISLKLNSDEKNVDILLNRLDIESYKYQKVKYLSGGQRQRVGVVRALTNNPSLILADEPTGALDHENSELLLKTLKDYSENSLVLMVTHNEELALKYVTRVIYMDHGEIIRDIVKESKDKEEPIKEKRKNKYKIFSKKLGYKYLISSLKTLKIRLFFLIGSGCIIFLFISFLFCALSSASTYVDNTYMYTPLYTVFDLCTYKEQDHDLLKENINSEVLSKLINRYDEVTYRENIDILLNKYMYQEITYENKVISNVKIYTLPNNIDDKVIVKGRFIQNKNEILINELFMSYFKDDNPLGRKLEVKEKFVYKGKEYVSTHTKEIVGVTKDSLFNQNNEIYVSYGEHLDYLKNNGISNKLSYFNAFFTFDYQLVINCPSDVSKIMNNIKKNPYYRNKENIPSHDYHFSIVNNIAYEEKEMFSELIDVVSILVYFFILLGLIVFTIFSSYVLSSFVLEKKKDYAIFSQLGIKNKCIYLLIMKESLLISLSMIFLGLLLFYLIYSIVSTIIKFKLTISILSIIFLILLYFLQCLISSLLPIIQLRKMEMGNILRYE